MEMKVTIALIEELRGKMALDLDPAPSFDRTLGPQRKAKKKCELMIVGCCKTKEMAKILSNRGKTTSSVFSNNWRITRASVESLATNLRRQIEAEEPETIVFELLDNSVFVGKQEDGSRLLPKKEADGRYHIQGEVQVCARDVQLEQFSALKPIFDAAADKKIIWMVPAARYLTSGCCENREHVSNKDDPDAAGVPEKEYERPCLLHQQADQNLRRQPEHQGHEQRRHLGRGSGPAQD
jgi:hypothetical protein